MRQLLLSHARGKDHIPLLYVFAYLFFSQYVLLQNHLGQLQVKAVERFGSGPNQFPVIRTIAGNQDDRWINDKIDFTSSRAALVNNNFQKRLKKIKKNSTA